MIVHAELSCMNCGYEIGEVEGEASASYENAIFLPVHQGDRLVTDAGGRIRCPRCTGYCLPHGVTPVRRPLDPVALLEPDICLVTRSQHMW
jgi:hypothetical protein